jgi:trimeric autotransporter adhesin
MSITLNGTTGVTTPALDASGTALVTGVLTANGGAVFNEGGADADFRVESDTNANALFVEGSSGNVGIGTSSPTRKLSISSTGQTDLSIRSADNSYAQLLFGDATEDNAGSVSYDNATNTMYFHTVTSGLAGRHMTIDSSGNVGIGTSSPASDTANERILQVNAPTTYATLSLSTSRESVAGNNIGKISFDVLNNTATYRSRAQIITESAGSTANKYGANMMFFTASDNTTDALERMRIDSSGGLITNPAAGGHAVFNEGGIDADFRVESDAGPYAFYMDAGANSGYGRTKITSSALATDTSVAGGDTGTHINGLTIENNEASYTNGGLALVNKYSWGYGSAIKWYNIYDQAGVGGTLGETNRIHSQYVSANNMDTVFSSMIGGAVTETLSIGANGTIVNDDGLDNDFRVESDTLSHALFVQGSDGDVYFNKSSSSLAVNGAAAFRPLSGMGKFSVSGSATSGFSTYEIYSTGVNAYRFYVEASGTVFATVTTISGISDVRKKENIRDITVGLSEILALKPRTFDWKEGQGKNISNDRGFIAQEFETVFPDLIDEWKDESPEGEDPYKSVRQELIPVLVKAIQEQQTLIEALTARITALENA